MKVLIINLRIGTGSVGRIVSDLYHGIVNAGHECKIAFGRGDTGDIPIKNTYRICSKTEVFLHAAFTRLFGNTAFYFSKTTQRFCRWIEEYAPDIVHIHGVYGYYLNMKTLYEYLGNSNAIVISTLHSCWDFTGHCCHFQLANCEQWKSGCMHCVQKNTYPISSFLDNTHKNYERKKSAYNTLKKCIIVTPSKWLAKLARQSFLKDKVIRVIYNGIDLDSFKVDKINNALQDVNKPIILCVASLWTQGKGWKDIIELSYTIPNKYQLIVVGVTKKQQKFLAPETISLQRTNSKAELAKLYSSATVFFNPTYEDNYPTVNLEAIACHTPIVTYNTGGSPEIIKHESWGIVIKERDYLSLYNFIEIICHNENKIDFTYISELSNKIMVDNYIKLYEEFLFKYHN